MNPTGMQAAIMRAMMQQQANRQNPSQPSSVSGASSESTATAPQAGQKVDEYGNIIPDPDVAVEWNKYQKWLREKGMLGKPELDKNNLGINLFNEWKKISGSPLTLDDMAAVRRLAGAEIERSLGLARSGKMGIFDDKGNFIREPKQVEAIYSSKTQTPWLENEKSAHPNYPGQFFTRFMIPLEYDEVSTTVDDSKIKNRADFEKNTTLRNKGVKVKYD